jgi:hypothetical protein
VAGGSDVRGGRVILSHFTTSPAAFLFLILLAAPAVYVPLSPRPAAARYHVALTVSVLGTVAFGHAHMPINRKRGCVAGYTKREALGRGTGRVERRDQNVRRV